MTNADKVHPEVEVQLLGEKRNIVFSTAAYCEIEELTGVDAMAGDFWTKLDTKTSLVLLWATAKAGGLKMSLEEFKEKITLKQLRGFRADLIACYEKSLPSAKPEEKKSEEPAPEKSESEQIG